MKKLSTKEKAELYDKAIKKAKSKVLYPGKPCFVNIKDIFPELVESEDLEIKSDIQYAVRCAYGDNSSKTERILAWLDKQGELVEINPTEFDTRLQALIGKSGSLPKEELIGSLSFWMNVVQNDGTYKPAEKQGEQKSTFDVEIPFGVKDSELVEASYYIPKGFHAEIDGDKVHIKKGEQKPAWSEDDEEMFKYAIGHFEIQKRNSIEGGLRKVSMQEFIDWIKSLKDRLV